MCRIAHGVAVRVGAVCHLKGVVRSALTADCKHESLEQFAFGSAFVIRFVHHIDKVDVRVKIATPCVRFLVHCAYRHSSVLFCRRETVHGKAFARAINRTACARSARIHCSILAAVPRCAVVHSRCLAATQLVKLDIKLFRRNRADHCNLKRICSNVCKVAARIVAFHGHFHGLVIAHVFIKIHTCYLETALLQCRRCIADNSEREIGNVCRHRCVIFFDYDT